MKRFITPIFFMLIASGIYVLYIDPTYAAIQLARAKKDAIEHSIADAAVARQKLEMLAAIEAGFPADYVSKLRTLLPETIDDTRLVIDVNAMAERNGLHIKTPNISTADSTKKGAIPYVRHNIVFSVHAPYSVFRSFLHDVEGNLALRDTSAISFSSQESSEDISKFKDPAMIPHEYSLTIVTYSLH